MLIPDSMVHRANMGPIWGRQDPGGPHGGLMCDEPHVGLMNFAIWNGFVVFHFAVSVILSFYDRFIWFIFSYSAGAHIIANKMQHAIANRTQQNTICVYDSWDVGYFPGNRVQLLVTN